MDIRIFPDLQTLSRAAADEFVTGAQRAIETRGIFTVVLSGGSTPRSLYRLLATDAGLRTAVPWAQVHFFWGDERLVPPDDPESNYRSASESFLSRLSIDMKQIHPIPTELPAEECAREYERELKAFFQLTPSSLPSFDLVFLGMGADGHTASLFPETTALGETSRLAAAPWVEKLGSHRITLTTPVLNQARAVIFLVSGADKAETLREVLRGKKDPQRFPAQLIQPANGKLIWLVDQPAASLLKKAS